MLAGFMVALLGAFVLLFPTGTWLHQRSELAGTSRQLSKLKAQNASLATQAKALKTKADIAYLAHKDYGLVAPGQEEYVILPTTTTTATTTTTTTITTTH